MMHFVQLEMLSIGLTRRQMGLIEIALVEIMAI